MMCAPDKYRIPFVEYHLRRFAKKTHMILDVGCGVGQYRNSTDGFYVGLDVTNEPYEYIGLRVVDIVGSGTDIPARGESFDLAFSVGALYQMANPRKVLIECFRILKPGGRLILFDYNRRTQKRLEISEGHKRPCWTQWGLRDLVQETGFARSELLLPLSHEVNGLEKVMRLLHNELWGEWAIVTGIK